MTIRSCIEAEISGRALVKTQEAARILETSESTIRRWIRSGKLEAAKTSRGYSIPSSELVRLFHESDNRRFEIPVTVESGPPISNNTWRSTPLLKTTKEEYSPGDLRTAADAITQYVFAKDLARPGRSWQDHFLHQKFLRRVVYEQVKDKLNAGKSMELVLLEAAFTNFPEIDLTEDEVAAAKDFINSGAREKGDVAHEEVADFIFKLKDSEFDAKELVRRDRSEGLRARKTAIVQIRRERIRGVVQGVIASLIASGVFESIKRIIESLAGRAAYTEAQIFETETDLWKEIERWHGASRPGLEVLVELRAVEREVLFILILHAIVVASVSGESLPKNPFFHRRIVPMKPEEDTRSNTEVLIEEAEKLGWDIVPLDSGPR